MAEPAALWHLESVSSSSVSNHFVSVYIFIPIVLSHVHKCHGSTQCSQCSQCSRCYRSPLTEAFVIVKLGARFVLLACRPPTSCIPVIMTVHRRVPKNWAVSIGLQFCCFRWYTEDTGRTDTTERERLDKK